MREGRVRVGRRRGLPASGQRRLGVGWERRHDPPVVLAPREHFPGDTRADCRTTLDEARRMVSKLAGERRAVRRRRAGVDGDEHVVRRLRGRRVRRSGGEAQPDTVRRELPLDRVDRVEHGDVRHREEARCQRVVRCRNGVLDDPIPFEHDAGVRAACAYAAAGGGHHRERYQVAPIRAFLNMSFHLTQKGVVRRRKC